MLGSRSVAYRFWLVVPVLIVLGPASPEIRAQNPPPPDATSTPPSDSWPRRSTIDGMGVTVYQPQVESWVDRKKFTGWSAMAYTPLTSSQAALGTTVSSQA